MNSSTYNASFLAGTEIRTKKLSESNEFFSDQDNHNVIKTLSLDTTKQNVVTKLVINQSKAIDSLGSMSLESWHKLSSNQVCDQKKKQQKSNEEQMLENIIMKNHFRVAGQENEDAYCNQKLLVPRIRFRKNHQNIVVAENVDKTRVNYNKVNKCHHHHRTRTRCKIVFDSMVKLINCNSCFQTQQLNVPTVIERRSQSKRCENLYKHWPLSRSFVQIIALQLVLIYVTLTSDFVSSIARASSASTTNYWPLVNQHRYQQLFFANRMQQQPQHHSDSQNLQIFHRPQLQVQPNRRLSLKSSNRQHSTSAAATAAAAAAMAATANAAKARQSQSHNLLIGQNYNNFSSIIPYSLMQDVDYPTMQEDPIINEQVNNLNGGYHHSNTDNEQHQAQLSQQVVNDEFDLSDSVKNSQFDQQSSDSIVQPQTKHLDQHEVQQHMQMLTSFLAESTQKTNNIKPAASDRAILDSNRLILPQMQQIKARFNQGCVGGTKCQFFAFCWMSGGSLGASCGLLMTCCVTPSRQEIQPGFYGPVVNDPYCGRSTSKINRIVGGTDASFGQFPWQAFVQVGGSRCGGALISSRHVVTAGHCVARSQHSPSSIKVTLGDYILNSDIESIPHEVYSVVEVLLHPNFRFTPQADRYDVAVLELDRAASYKDNIKPICLPQKDATFVGRVAYVAGWGALQAGSKLRPKVLQHVAVPVIENQVCESWHRRKGIDIRIYDEMMCAGYELGQRDACQGDSGGPLMLNQFGVWYLVGIVSAGYSCAKQYQPGIYHRVSSSSDWISSNVYQQGNSK